MCNTRRTRMRRYRRKGRRDGYGFVWSNHKRPHSPDERVEINSVDKFWHLLLKILRELAKK